MGSRDRGSSSRRVVYLFKRTHQIFLEGLDRKSVTVPLGVYYEKVSVLLYSLVYSLSSVTEGGVGSYPEPG